MKYQLILVLLFLIVSTSCSNEVSTPVQVLPTPTTTALEPTGIPALPDEDRPLRAIKGGPLCENYILASIGASKTRESQPVKLKGVSAQDETLSSDLRKWLKTADSKKLVFFDLRGGAKKALVFGSRNVEATGLASNLEYWAIEIDEHLIEFRSLSHDPRLIFWDKDSLLNYYVVDFSAEFIEERDFDHPSLDLRRFVINDDGRSQLVSEERNVKCD